jgi:transcriptional regulator with XRE-family HTH domain
MKKKELTPQQVIACQLWLARKQNKMTLDDIAKEVGVTRRTLYTWSQSDEWKQFAHETTISVAREHLPEVMDNLISQAKTSKNAKIIELFLRTVGVLGQDTMKVEVNNNGVEERSNESKLAEIAQLKRLLGQDVEEVKQPTKEELKRKEYEEIKRMLNDMH